MENEELSSEVKEIMKYVPNWMILWGNTLFFLVLLVTLVASWHIKYPTQVSAELSRFHQITETNTAIIEVKVPINKINQMKRGNYLKVILYNKTNQEPYTLKGQVKKINMVSDDKTFFKMNIELAGTSQDTVDIFSTEGFKNEARLILEDVRLIQKFFSDFKIPS